VVLPKWLIWDNKSDKELTALMLLEIQQLLLEKVLLLDLLLWYHYHFMVVSYIMLNYLIQQFL
jgi:hypothetical protein